MRLKKNIPQSDEIDLVEIYFIILKNKARIFLTIFISLTLMIGYLYFQKTKKLEYEANAGITPISKFEVFEYEDYNDYLSNTGSIILQYPIKMKNETFIVNEVTMDLKDASFKKIDQEYLMDLFIQKIHDKTFMDKVVIDSKIINKEDYENDLKYKNAISEFISTIKLIPTKGENKNNNIWSPENTWNISFIIDSDEKTKKFLNKLQLMTNLEIKNYLVDIFNSKIKTQREIKKYNIQDIELEISNAIDESYLRRLELEKVKLLNQNDIDRLINVFNKTPIINSTEFIAGKIETDKIYYRSLGKNLPSNTTMIIIAIIFGTIFGIFFILASTAIQKRVKYKKNQR